MAVTVAVEELRGREAESGRVESLLDGARAGRSDVLVLRGEAGIGTSALLRHAVAAAGVDMPVLHAVGLESESDLAFAGLHQLLRPVLDRLDCLPGPQAASFIGQASGLTDGAQALLLVLAAARASSTASTCRRTVEHHLSKIFSKLDISSRVELARALAQREQAGD